MKETDPPMTMHMNHTLHSLRSSLPRYAADFARVSARRPALASYPDAEAVLAALAITSELDADQRAEIVRAFVAEKQASKHPLWVAMLLLAFAPAMFGLRSGLVRRHPEDEVDQVLVASLLEAADAVQPETAKCILLSIRQGMTRGALRKLRVDDPGALVPLCDDTVGDVPWWADAQPFVACAAREVLEASKRVRGAPEALGQLSVFGRKKKVPRSETTAEERGGMRSLQQRNNRAVSRLRKSLGIRKDEP